jgi:hypothetical protein
LWLEEISRVLRRGGTAFLTVHTEGTFAEPDAEHFPFRKILSLAPYSVSGRGVFMPEVTDAAFAPEMLIDRLVFTPINGPAKDTQVFHRLDYIKNRWGQFFTVEEIIPRAHGLQQDGIVLRKS